MTHAIVLSSGTLGRTVQERQTCLLLPSGLLQKGIISQELEMFGGKSLKIANVLKAFLPTNERGRVGASPSSQRVELCEKDSRDPVYLLERQSVGLSLKPNSGSLSLWLASDYQMVG